MVNWNASQYLSQKKKKRKEYIANSGEDEKAPASKKERRKPSVWTQIREDASLTEKERGSVWSIKKERQATVVLNASGLSRGLLV